ncbi:restriction endonuclease subunit S [Methanosphaera cuniculi]|uniref:EcoKI restriction-modification system protein HsdS n=1 Tax=Methanosphaera cuniculi TaxID=1077256 RepID=A0A2A2HCM8_9EURY|nr:restriction endonuclease subunit S [Methanosphaera cuniculi]PAV07172.1 hypothetical protein ASJ82_05720 [Methanosphaera cuniculi]PWL07623.1 EcoKI restriction-modification system protein HsdS [Methanosphaera cuniculi]
MFFKHPKLYFKDKKLDKKKLSDIAIIKTGFTPSTTNPKYWNGEFPWLSVADMNSKYIKNTTKTITDTGTMKKEIVKKGTLIMSFKLTIGKLGILTKDMYTNEAICNFTWKNKNISTEFMYYYLSSINIEKYGVQAAKGITLNKNSLSSIPVKIPSINSKIKIAYFLSEIDTKIALMEQKKSEIINLKKCFIHKIFDDFLKNNNDFPLMNFSDLTKQIIGGSTPQTKNLLFWNGNINWFTPSEVGESKYLYESKRKITKLGVEKSSVKLIPKNSIILTTRATIGRKSITTEESTTNQGCHSLILKDNVDINFIYYLLDSIQNELIRKSVGSTFIEINKKEIENISIKVPPYKIQQKIGDFLSSIDKKIKLTSKQVELMKMYKNGLLQKMFI